VTPPESGSVHDGLGPLDIDAQESGSVVYASWHGFVDLESGVVSYDVAVGTADAPESAAGFADVGLNTTLSLPLSLTEGETYVVSVRARNSLGLVSEVARSNGVRVDTTPPVAVGCSVDAAAELLQDGLFEALAGDGSPAAAWNLTGTAEVTPNQHLGHTPLSLRLGPLARAAQRVALQKGARYDLRFLVAVDDTEAGAVQGGRVQIGGALVRSFAAQHTDARTYPTFTEHVYHFTAPADDANALVTFETLPLHGDTLGLLFTAPELRECSSDSGVPASVTVGSDVVGGANRLMANWQLSDEESGIAETLWALGTSEGGAQLQDFVPVGRQSSAVAEDLVLPHNASVYVTVVARNTLGAATTLSSAPVLVDLTPPDVAVRSPAAIGVAAAGQFSVSWVAQDAESGISACSLTLARAPGQTQAVDVLATVTLTTDATPGLTNSGVETVTLPSSVLENSDLFFATITCSNKARLTAHGSSAGTALLLAVPDASGAVVTVASQPEAEGAIAPLYTGIHGMQSSRTEVQVSWYGFQTPLPGVALEYAVTLTGPGLPSAGVTSTVVGAQDTFFGGLALSEGRSYTVSVFAQDPAAQQSAAASAALVVDTTPAAVVGVDRICAARDASAITLRWADAFAESACPPQPSSELNAATCLRYEVSIGLVSGGGEVASRLLMTEPELVLEKDVLVKDADGLIDFEVPYQAHITAINGVGLHVTRSVNLADVVAC